MSDNKIVAGMTAFVVILGGATAYGVYSGINTAAQESVEYLVKKVERQSNGSTTITYGDVQPNYMDQTVTVKDVAFEVKDVGTTTTIEAVTFSSEGYVENEQFPTSLDLSIDGLEIAHEGLRFALNSEIGPDYFDHKINGVLGYDFDKESDVLTPYARMNIDDVNEMSVNLTVSNVRGIWNTIEANYASNDGKIDFERKEGRELSRMMPKIRINDMAVNYVNSGEIEAALESFASDKGMTVNELQMEMPGAIDYYLGDVEFAKDAQTFLANPKSLSVSIAPKNSMTPQELVERFQMLSKRRGSDEALEGMDLKIKVNQPSQ